MAYNCREPWQGIAEKYTGKPILFGIRPEDIGSERAEDTKGGQMLHAKIEVMEPMGAETYLYLDTPTDNGVSCIARVDAHKVAKVGESLSLPVSMENAHLFDSETTKILI